MLLMGLPALAWGQKTVLESEDKRFAATCAQDTVALAALIHPDLVYVHSNALRESKSDFIRSVASGKFRYLSVNRTKFELEKGRKTSIVNGEAQVKLRYNGTELDLNLRYLAIYRKVRGRWLLLRWQSTKY